jgi:hypothetical protein
LPEARCNLHVVQREGSLEYLRAARSGIRPRGGSGSWQPAAGRTVHGEQDEVLDEAAHRVSMRVLRVHRAGVGRGLSRRSARV